MWFWRERNNNKNDLGDDFLEFPKRNHNFLFQILTIHDIFLCPIIQIQQRSLGQSAILNQSQTSKHCHSTILLTKKRAMVDFRGHVTFQSQKTRRWMKMMSTRMHTVLSYQGFNLEGNLSFLGGAPDHTHLDVHNAGMIAYTEHVIWQEVSKRKRLHSISLQVHSTQGYEQIALREPLHATINPKLDGLFCRTTQDLLYRCHISPHFGSAGSWQARPHWDQRCFTWPNCSIT